MNFELIFNINNLDEAKVLAQAIAKSLYSGLKLSFDGQLGAGKTTLIKLILSEMGIRSEAVTSPTFTLVNEFPLKNYAKIFHLDLYRLNDVSQLLDTGIKDELDNPNNIFFIEWAYKIKSYELFKPFVGFFIKVIEDDIRIVHIFSDDNETKKFFDNIKENLIL